MVFDDIRRCDEHPVADFTDEAELFRFVRASRWVSVDFAGHRVLRLNWVVTALAVVVLWGFSISALVAPDDTLAQAAKWQSWVTQNFAWLYIGTQNVWAFFLIYVAFSKYGRLITDAEIDNIMVQHDKAGNDAISKDEFKMMVLDIDD